MVQAGAAMAAGLITALVTSPIDLAKSRIMNQKQRLAQLAAATVASSSTPPVPPERLYRSTLDCLVKTARSEGPLAVYKGFLPNWLRLGPHTLITFLVYERLRIAFHVKPV
jgi:hypothetical protein